MKFTQVPTDAFQKMQLNAGLLVKGATGFAPATGTVTTANILGATSGGIKASATPSFMDMGDGVDNCPKNVKELKQVDDWDCKLSATFVTVDTALAKMSLAAADIDTLDTTKVEPRFDLKATDFDDVWFVGDYSDKNGPSNGGFVAIHLMNALSVGGFQLQSSNKGKAQFAVEFMGHVSLTTQTVVPFEVYVKAGAAE